MLISLIINVMLFIGISAYIWREARRKDSCYINNLDFACMTFIGAPILAVIVWLGGYVLIDFVGLWLIPIVLIIVSVLVFVFWDDLNELCKKAEDE